MSMDSVSVPQFARRNKVSAPGVSQTKAKTQPVPVKYPLLEQEGWSAQSSKNAVLRAVGNCPGMEAGEIAEAAADIVELSPEAREVKTSDGREKYRVDTYHRLYSMTKSGLMERDPSSGRYTLTDKGRAMYQKLLVAIREPIQKPIQGVYLGEPIIIQADRHFV